MCSPPCSLRSGVMGKRPPATLGPPSLALPANSPPQLQRGFFWPNLLLGPLLGLDARDLLPRRGWNGRSVEGSWHSICPSVVFPTFDHTELQYCTGQPQVATPSQASRHVAAGVPCDRDRRRSPAVRGGEVGGTFGRMPLGRPPAPSLVAHCLPRHCLRATSDAWCIRAGGLRAPLRALESGVCEYLSSFHCLSQWRPRQNRSPPTARGAVGFAAWSSSLKPRNVMDPVRLPRISVDKTIDAAAASTDTADGAFAVPQTELGTPPLPRAVSRPDTLAGHPAICLLGSSVSVLPKLMQRGRLRGLLCAQGLCYAAHFYFWGGCPTAGKGRIGCASLVPTGSAFDIRRGVGTLHAAQLALPWAWEGGGPRCGFRLESGTMTLCLRSRRGSSVNLALARVPSARPLPVPGPLSQPSRAPWHVRP